MLRDISEGEGDLTRRLDADGKDEIADLARWFNRFAEKLQGVIGEVAADTVSMSSASQELASTAVQLARGAEETTGQSATVSAAAEEMASVDLIVPCRHPVSLPLVAGDRQIDPPAGTSRLPRRIENLRHDHVGFQRREPRR